MARVVPPVGRRRIAAISTLIAIIGAIAIVISAPAPVSAQHGDKNIQAYPDVQRAKIGTNPAVNVLIDPFSPPTSPINITIMAEVVGGPADPDVGYTPFTPDNSCPITIPAGPVPATQQQRTCQLFFEGETPGTSLIYIWVDENNTPGTVEVDKNEGRLASNSTDCDLTLDQAAYDDCQMGTADEGTTPEPDDSDLVEITFYPAPDILECAALPQQAEVDTTTVREDAVARFDCLARSLSGAPVANAVLDAENFSATDSRVWTNDGANDPDGGTPPPEGSPEDKKISPNYNDVCTTGANGHCTVQIGASKGQLGSAVVCIWIDGIVGTINPPSDPDVPDTSWDRPSTTATDEETDGGACIDEKVDEAIAVAPFGGPGKFPGHEWGKTELVTVNWEPPMVLKGGIDVRPETQQLDAGETASLTAMAYDQFGVPMKNIIVNWEIFRRSVSDTEDPTANSPDTPDRTCTTDSEGVCSVTLSGNRGGTDLVCAWTHQQVGEPAATRPKPTVNGTNVNGTCGDATSSTVPLEGRQDNDADDGVPYPAADAFDVVEIQWIQPEVVPPPPPPPPPVPTAAGYWLIASDGGVFTFGDVAFYGSTGNMTLNKPIVTSTATKSGNGYWLIASDGGVFTFGDAAFHGSTGAMSLNKPIVGMAPTPSGNGYWLVASDGGIFSFGDAAFHGSTGAMSLNKPIIGMTPTPTGGGYWLVASDGGIFSFGDAGYFGSTGDFPLNAPIVAIAATPSGKGYWLVGADGAIFTFGDASYFGGVGDGPLNKPIVGMTPTPSGDGYYLVASDGGMFAFGDAKFYGSTGGMTLNKPILGMAVSVKLLPPTA